MGKVQNILVDLWKFGNKEEKGLEFHEHQRVGGNP